MEEKVFITRQQQQRLYAIVDVMSKQLDWNKTRLMQQMKDLFMEAWGYGDRRFSTALDKCQLKEFEMFKDFLLDTAMEQGVVFFGVPGIYFDDIEQYVSMCIKNRQCCVSQMSHDPENNRIVDIHHVDKIGMGNDRRKADHSSLRRMPLLRHLHQESHTIGEDTFQEKYHVVGVLTKYRCGPEYDDEIDREKQERKDSLIQRLNAADAADGLGEEN